MDIAIYQGQYFMGWGNKQHWDRICTQKKIFRVLFMDIDEKELSLLEELTLVNQKQLVQVLYDSLENNPFTTYMS